MDRQEREDIVETALQRQFKSLWEWRRPTLDVSLGPNDIDVVDSFEEYREKFFVAARRDLLARSNADVARILNYDPLTLDETHWLRYLTSGDCRKNRKAPPAIAYGFGHPSFSADFTHWCKMPSLKTHEALLLSVGVDPTSITEDQIDKVQQKVSEERQWAAHTFLLKRRALFERQFRHAGWGFSGALLYDLVAWFERGGVVRAH